jgi:hypothetical protein
LREKPPNLSFRGQVYRPRNLLFADGGAADSSRDNATLRNDKPFDFDIQNPVLVQFEFLRDSTWNQPVGNCGHAL